MNGMTHERCSELLGPHLRGELDPDEARAVEHHLASCPECRQEQRALQAMAEEVEGISDIERARLHRSVWDEVRNEVRPSRPGKRPLGARLGPVLGAAALVALIAVGIVSGGTGGDDAGDADSGAGGDAATSQDAPANEAEELNADSETAEDTAAGKADPEPEETSLTAADPGASPYFERDAGLYSRARFRLIGRGGPFTNYAGTFDAARAEEVQGHYFELLDEAAPDEIGDVRACTERAAAEFGETALAGYGGTGTYDGSAALVLGFAYSSNSRDVDTWGFAIMDEGDCERILEVFSGRIGR